MGGGAVVNLFALGDERLYIGKTVFKRRSRHCRVIRQHIVDRVFQTQIRQIFGKTDLCHIFEVLGKIRRRKIDDAGDLIKRDLVLEVFIDIGDRGLGIGEVAPGRRRISRQPFEMYALCQQHIIKLVDVGNLDQRGIIAVDVDRGDLSEHVDDLRVHGRIVSVIKQHAVNGFAEHADVFNRKIHTQQTAAGAVDRAHKMDVLTVKNDKIILIHDAGFTVAAALRFALDDKNDLRLAVPLQLGFVRIG